MGSLSSQQGLLPVRSERGMESVMPVLVVLVMVFTCAADCSAAGQSLFAFRASDGWLVEVILPDSQTGSSATIKKTFVGDVWAPFASTRDDSGRIISSGPDYSSLDAYVPFSGVVEEICTFGQSWMNTNDLTFGPSGELLWANSGPSGTTLYVIDMATCGLTEWGSFQVNHVRTIEYHQGAFYCSGDGAELFRIDAQTFDTTIVIPANYYCGVDGLSSDGNSLYYVWGCGFGANSPTYHDVGEIDPQSGEVLWSVFIPNDEFHEGYTMIEVVDQPIRPIPAVNTFGGSLLAVLIGLVGLLLARRL